MSQRRAFVAGYAPSAASPYYSSLQLLGEASRGAATGLLERIGDESDRVVALRGAAAAEVARAGAALAALGAVVPPPPAGAEAYPDWVEAVFGGVSGALEPGSPEAVAHLLGHVLGEAMATLDALAVVARLQGVAAEHLLLRVQAQSLEHERARAERRLGRLAAHPLLHESAQSLVGVAAQRAAAGSSPQPLAELAGEIERALAS